MCDRFWFTERMKALHASPCAGPNAGTFLHSWGQSGLSHSPGAHASILGYGCSPSAVLSCETQICEPKESPRWTLTPHRVSLQCSDCSFPSGLPQHPCLQLSLLNILLQQKCCRFSCRTEAMEVPLAAEWDKTPPPPYDESRIATAWLGSNPGYMK